MSGVSEELKKEMEQNNREVIKRLFDTGYIRPISELPGRDMYAKKEHERSRSMNADKPTLYPEMNANIVGRLRTSDSPASHYAAALIESLQAQLAESRERERAAVHDIELVLNGAGVCHVCANGDCKDGEHCEPKWRGPAGEGAGE